MRHGLWDYDLPAAPTLLTINVDGREIDAVAAPAKTGFVYVFDRVTGEPVWPIEDRAVPPSDVPGERAAATQPFPTRPAPFAKQGFTEEDVIAFTPELQEEALEIVRKYRMGGLYNPPSIEGTIASPGVLGGANWGGAAADPETGVIYIKANEFPALLAITEANPDRNEGPYGLNRARRSLNLPSGLPINKPPYGTITAIDLNTGEHLFQVPAGNNPLVRDHQALEGVEIGDERLGVVGAPGPMVTGGGLVFFTGGADHLFAIDKTHRRGAVGPPARSQFLREPHDLRIPRRSPVRGGRRGDAARATNWSRSRSGSRPPPATERTVSFPATPRTEDRAENRKIAPTQEISPGDSTCRFPLSMTPTPFAPCGRNSPTAG